MENDAKKLSQLLKSYDEEIARQKASLEAIEFLRGLVAQHLQSLTEADQLREVY